MSISTLPPQMACKGSLPGPAPWGSGLRQVGRELALPTSFPWCGCRWSGDRIWKTTALKRVRSTKASCSRRKKCGIRKPWTESQEPRVLSAALHLTGRTLSAHPARFPQDSLSIHYAQRTECTNDLHLHTAFKSVWGRCVHNHCHTYRNVLGAIK